MSTGEWIAEDVPWYLIDKDAERPWRDEDMAMSATQRLAVRDTELHAREALSNHLMSISRYGHVIRGGESETYEQAAVLVLRPGYGGIRIHGRYYRVRKA